MGLPEKEWPVVNRYQHLGFYTDASVENVSGYRASAASVDYVRVDIHPQRFDFSKTGAQRVVVEAAQANDLRSNASLTWMGEYRRLHWFAIKKEGR